MACSHYICICIIPGGFESESDGDDLDDSDGDEDGDEEDEEAALLRLAEGDEVAAEELRKARVEERKRVREQQEAAMILRKQFEQRVKINRARRRAAHQSQSQAAGHLLSTSRDTPFQQTLLSHLSNTNASTLFTLSPLFHPHNPRNPFSTPFLPLPSHPPSPPPLLHHPQATTLKPVNSIAHRALTLNSTTTLTHNHSVDPFRCPSIWIPSTSSLPLPMPPWGVVRVARLWV